MATKLLITVCGRAGSKGFKNKNLKTFCGKPLAHYSLAAVELFLAEMHDVQADIVLNTDSGLLKDIVLGSYPETVILHRPAELAGDAVPKMAVFQHSLRTMEERRGLEYDYLMDLDITSPLRRVGDAAGICRQALARPDLDVVMSAVPSRRSPYMNMARRVGGCVEQVVKTEFVARQQVPACYDLNASLYMFKRSFLRENTTGFLWDGRCDIYEMQDTGVLDIDSEEDFQLMEIIARHLFANDPDYSAIRDAIR